MTDPAQSLGDRLTEWAKNELAADDAQQQAAIRTMPPARRATRRPTGAQPEQEAPRDLELIELGPLLELPLDRPRELIGELMREGSLGMIHAQAGAGKTFFALGMAVSLTRGAPFLGYPVAKAFPALYCDGEMAAFDLRERLRLLSIPLETSAAQLYVVTPDLSPRGIPKVDCDEGRNALVAQLDERPEIKLVVLDNLACLTRPDGDDTHGARSFTFVQDLMLECRRRSVACWIVHHSGKSGEQRGTSKRNDVLDVVLKLTPALSTEGHTEVSVTFEKARHMRAESKADFTAVLEPAMGDGLVWTRAGSQLPINERIRLMLLDGMPPGEVATELKCNRSFVYRLREQLVQSGDLAKRKTVPSGDKSRVVSLSPPNRGTGDRRQNQETDGRHGRQRFEY